MNPRQHDITPSASRLTTSLRDIGYDFSTAIADLVDNSISAQATEVHISVVHSGRDSWIMVADDGCGMTSAQVTEALRFGTRREYGEDDLGRFGLGMKTAALSVGRRLTVVSRHAPTYRRITRRSLDLDLITERDSWTVHDAEAGREAVAIAARKLVEAPGTVILLEKLDRVFEGVDAASGWGRRRLEKLSEELSLYLGMVFHRFIEGTADRGRTFKLRINGRQIPAWNPFAPTERATRQLEPVRYELTDDNGVGGSVLMRRFILPARSEFSSQEEFERLSGPRKWNRQQGLYLYRGDRMVQAGTWAGLRAMDEHTKLARATLEFPVHVDELFRINVAKMRAQIPSKLKEPIAKPINELCALADGRYRRAGLRSRREERDENGQSRSNGTAVDLRTVGTALRIAAELSDQSRALRMIGRTLRDVDHEIAVALGI